MDWYYTAHYLTLLGMIQLIKLLFFNDLMIATDIYPDENYYFLKYVTNNAGLNWGIKFSFTDT